MKRRSAAAHALIVVVAVTACGTGDGTTSPTLDGAADSSATPAEEDSASTAVDSGADAAVEEGFEPLFGGEDLDGFELVGVSMDDLSVEDGVLKCRCSTNGYLYKDEVFADFDLRLSFRFERPPGLAAGADDTFTGNSGYFVYLEPPHGIWPRCLEVQGSYLETGDVFELPGLTSGNDAPDFVAMQTARRPVGEWNDLRILSRAGALEINLNGRRVNASAPGELREGLIALESEGAEVHWRDLRIRRLP